MDSNLPHIIRNPDTFIVLRECFKNWILPTNTPRYDDHRQMERLSDSGGLSMTISSSNIPLAPTKTSTCDLWTGSYIIIPKDHTDE